MGNRSSIKCDDEVFDQLNAERKERGLTWNEYLTELQQGGDIGPGDLTVALDDEEVIREMVEQLAEEGGLVDVNINTTELAKDIAGFAGGGEFDEDKLADRVAERVSSDVRDTMRSVVGR